jgi:hypothetical protein
MMHVSASIIIGRASAATSQYPVAPGVRIRLPKKLGDDQIARRAFQTMRDSKKSLPLALRSYS